ncbi:rhomboid family intramembrane serine protease [Gryllotalpicola ginsengisoli]|uniref:rhomboid family intramembrane serine protease n=1 Tax=Gryllotalpicola ginsengisoli TaxID=444608 RepID=UPI0003B64A32|nr:rhomboid family intramembrane serine protease [Gryllotalpicola ginsengisoli]
MTDYRSDPANYCYRHPDRQSFVLCQRCGRTICGECQTPAPVGVICPECMREQRAEARETAYTRGSGYSGYGGGASARPPRVRSSRLVRRITGLAAAGHPIATYGVMAATALVFLLGVLPVIGTSVLGALSYSANWLAPWRVVTPILITGSPLSVLFALLSIWMLGQVLEQLLGWWRFLVVYFASGVTGGLIMLWVSGFYTTAGAFASIFGLFGAMVIVQRRMGGRVGPVLLFVAINLAINVFFSGWLVLVIGIGGLIGGLIVGFILLETRQVRRQKLQVWLLVGYCAVLLVLGCVPMVIHTV